jgi:polysaccharide pyruvyl transferase WcaK-like protein
LNQLREFVITSRVDSVVFGGGSVFHSEDDLKKYASWMRRARPGLRCAAGVSIGPFRTRAAEDSCARILKEMTFIGVRDTASFDRVQAIAPGSRLELTFDLAPLLLTHVQTASRRQPIGRELAVSLCALHGAAAEPPWLGELASSLKRLGRRGLFDRVALVDLNGEKLASGQSDYALHSRLEHALAGHVPVEHVPYTNDPRATISRLETSSAVLAMRLHAGVFAYALERPFALIRYHEKSGGWGRAIGLPPCLSIDMHDVDSAGLERMLETALSASPPRPTLPVTQAIDRALRNWTWVRS